MGQNPWGSTLGGKPGKGAPSGVHHCSSPSHSLMFTKVKLEQILKGPEEALSDL